MRQSLLDRIIRFAAGSDAVSALILIGSQARSETPADAYSDTDLVLAVNDVDVFIKSDAWLKQIGEAHISFTEPTVDGQIERRVLFDGAEDVDFLILQNEVAAHALETGDAAFVLGRGYKVLVDKRGYALPPNMAAAPAFVPANDAQYQNTVSDFWYHTVWTAKKLLRNELWTAKACVDGYLKGMLLWMIEQHTHTVSGYTGDTWYNGRFIERWAAEDILRDLQTSYAHFTREDMARALFQTMRLYRRLSRELADKAGFAYPAHADTFATQWVTERLAPLLPAATSEGSAP